MFTKFSEISNVVNADVVLNFVFNLGEMQVLRGTTPGFI